MEREAADEFYGNFNKAYQECITTFQMAFPELRALSVHLRVINKLLTTDRDSRKVFEIVKPNITRVFSDIHNKNAKIFLRDYFKDNKTGKPIIIKWFDVSCLYEIWPRLHASEQRETWEGLQGIVEKAALLVGTGTEANLDRMTALAKKFIHTNPNIREQDVQKQVFEQMFTNPEIAEGMKEMMVRGDVASFGSSFGSMIRGLGVVPPPQTQEATPQVEVPEMYTEELEAARAKSASDPMSQKFAAMALESKEREAEKKAMPQMGGFNEMLASLEDPASLSAEKLQSIRSTASSVLGVGADPTKTAAVQKLFGLMLNKAPQQEFDETLRKDFGASEEDIAAANKYRSMTGDFGALQEHVVFHTAQKASASS